MEVTVDKWSSKEFKVNLCLAGLCLFAGIVLASIGGSSETIQEDYALSMLNGGKMLMFLGPIWCGIAASKWFMQ